jgi:hypothetical protein
MSRNRIPLFCLTALVALASTGLLNAQTVTMSALNIDRDGAEYAKVLGAGGSGAYVQLSNLPIDNERARTGLRMRKNEIAYFDSKLEVKWKQAQMAKPSAGDPDQLFVFRNHLISVTRIISKPESEIRLYIQAFDSSGKELLAERLAYAGSYQRGSSIGATRSLLSPDKNGVALVIIERNGESAWSHQVNLDSLLRPVDQAKLAFKTTSPESRFPESGLLDDGRTYFIEQAPLDEPARRDEPFLSFTLHLQQTGSPAFKRIPLNGSDRPMREIGMTFDKANQKIILTGFHVDKTSFSGVGLLYCTTGISDSSTSSILSAPIDAEAHRKLIGRRNTGGGLGIEEYPIQRIIARSDGGAVIIAEAIYLSEYSFYDYFTQTYNRRIEYHFDNLILFSVDAAGNTDWLHVIEKDQRSMDDAGMYSSFIPYVMPEELVIAFGNGTGKTDNLNLLRYNPDGNAMSLRARTGGEQLSILPRFGKQVDGGTLIMPVVSRKRLFLAKLSF